MGRHLPVCGSQLRRRRRLPGRGVHLRRTRHGEPESLPEQPGKVHGRRRWRQQQRHRLGQPQVEVPGRELCVNILKIRRNQKN